jgi:GDP-4-dehydro-6-deoxy-D-mannose reductase
LTVLVTGGSGFIGSYIIRELAGRGEEVYSADSSDRKGQFKIEDAKYIRANMASEKQVERVVTTVMPDLIFHLAAQPNPVKSWEDPADTFKTNVLGTIHLFESLRRHNRNTKVVVACSSAAYGDQVTHPTGEDTILRPLSPYGVSKAAQDMLVYQYNRSYNLPYYCLRLFGTTGPGKTGDVVSDFASRIAAIEKHGGILEVGNLNTIRDISDVRDVVKAFLLVAEKGEPGKPYNVGSGRKYRVRDILSDLLYMASRKIFYEVDESRIRPTDEYMISPDISRIKLLGYEPDIRMSKTLEDTLDYWREKVSIESAGKMQKIKA